MIVEMVVSEPFEAYEVSKGSIPDCILKAYSWPLSVRFHLEDGRILRLPIGVYFKLKYLGKANVRIFSPYHKGLIIAYLRVIYR